MSQTLQDHNGFADNPVYTVWDLDSLIILHSVRISDKKERDRFFKYIKEQYEDRRIQAERIDKSGITIINMEDL